MARSHVCVCVCTCICSIMQDACLILRRHRFWDVYIYMCVCVCVCVCLCVFVCVYIYTHTCICGIMQDTCLILRRHRFGDTCMCHRIVTSLCVRTHVLHKCTWWSCDNNDPAIHACLCVHIHVQHTCMRWSCDDSHSAMHACLCVRIHVHTCNIHAWEWWQPFCGPCMQLFLQGERKQSPSLKTRVWVWVFWLPGHTFTHDTHHTYINTYIDT
jgi:hypothetical protein